MLVIPKRVKFRKNALVEFDSDGTQVIGIVVRQKGSKVAVRYGLEQILNFMWYEVTMVETEVGEDSGEGGDEEVFITRRSSDDYDLVW